MPKLIDADKLKHYLTDMKGKYPGPVGGALYVVLQQIESGTFDPTPVQPDKLEAGDRVRHKMYDMGDGLVMGYTDADYINVQFPDIYIVCDPGQLEVTPNGD